MTLRALYNHVVRTITEACKEANLESAKQHKHDDGRRMKRHGGNGHGNLSSREMFSGSITYNGGGS